MSTPCTIAKVCIGRPRDAPKPPPNFALDVHTTHPHHRQTFVRLYDALAPHSTAALNDRTPTQRHAQTPVNRLRRAKLLAPAPKVPVSNTRTEHPHQNHAPNTRAKTTRQTPAPNIRTKTTRQKPAPNIRTKHPRRTPAPNPRAGRLHRPSPLTARAGCDTRRHTVPV